ncbi:MAG: efflux RND transporter periplasmic adaptor subunit [bacterium]|nr:efflux RND transporter periplasmic adaptor subunit [bacterium]
MHVTPTHPLRPHRCTRRTVCLAALVALAGCSGDGETKTTSDLLMPPVMVGHAVQRDVMDRIKATGQLTAKAEATIAAQVDGQVTAIRVREGEAVERGAVLLVIDPERRQLEVASAEAQLAETKAELAVASRNYQRTKRLSKGNAASEMRLDEDRTRESLARSALAGAQARLGLARRALADATVRAPFSGLIARRHVSVGEYLSSATALFELVALDPIEVEFTLAEIDSSKVALGHPVEITVAPYPDERFMATVNMISPTIDPQTRTLRVKAELPNPDGRIRPGLFAHADLGVSKRANAITVPVDAVQQRADGAVIFRLVDSTRVERVTVETGALGEGWVEIRRGLHPADVVVLRGQGRREDAIIVTVRQADGRPVEAPSVAARGGNAPVERTP